MTETAAAVIDRYITLVERMAHDPAPLEDILALFGPDATVQLHEDQQPLAGIPALRELYAGIAKGVADSKTVWSTTVLDDGRIELRWLYVARGDDDRLTALSGIEYATLDAYGLITNLRNRMVTPDSRPCPGQYARARAFTTKLKMEELQCPRRPPQ
ncbi:ethyl tert-butyl ether degradation protein EthD [Streptomyces sp. ME18-1-4]|uniref:ethyl tert-butyl ether degradation protein EthD n=1 Tax=Streptomyces sp. ME18-1-4 TaxID=3028685 RepID=UPI0029AC6CD6|nr:ethyl tert-butyl ether degradation protein EthD [Streptomyces sp. ME18-1-4]MDX3240430.1 ethyl tert-butyl ether degradation protein EthD [Streptomyces sp. ME18-1-4]